MSLVVFTGGARSGKSALAQELARARALDGARVVVAVFGDGGADEETAARIERHRRDRPADFAVVEARDSVSWMRDVADDDLLLIDCLGTLVTLALDETLGDEGVLAEGFDTCHDDAAESQDTPPSVPAPALETQVESRVDGVVDSIMSRTGDTIVVTNEVGDGVVPAFAAGRLFRDVLGRANRRLVRVADAAYLVVCGRALDLEALPSTVRWPED